MVVEPTDVAVWLLINLQILKFISLRSYHSLFSHSFFANIQTNATFMDSIKKTLQKRMFINFELCLVSLTPWKEQTTT